MIRMIAIVRTMVITSAFFAGAPTLLVTLGGNPLPDHAPSSAQIQAWLDDPPRPGGTSAIWVAAWLVWAVPACLIVSFWVLRVRRWRWARLIAYLPGPVQGLAATLLGAAAVTTTVTAIPAEAAAATATDTSPTTGTVDAADPAPATTGQRQSTPNPAAAPRTVTVHRGDTLWDIADHRLGNPQHWRHIYALNRGRPQPGGHTLTDPDQIDVGWTLRLPARPAPSTAPEGSNHTPRPAERHPTPPAASSPPAPNENGPSTGITPPDGHPARPTTPVGATEASPSAPARAAEQPRPRASNTTTPDPRPPDAQDAHGGITLPSHGWVSLGLAALIAAVAALLRGQQRRHARLGFPIPARLEPQPTPVPASLTPVDNAGARRTRTDDEPPATPAVAAPIGLDAAGNEMSLFDLPGPGLALTGNGAEPAARALLAAALATGATHSAQARPVVATTTEILARLLPTSAPLTGLDPDGTSYDGERLIVLPDTAAAITHAEEEMIMRRRLLDTFHLDTVTALNERTDHAETQPPYVLLIEATTRHAARLRAVGGHRPALHLHPVVLGDLDGLPTIEVAADGITSNEAAGPARLSTLAAGDLAAVLSMLTDAAPRPESGHDLDLDPSDPAAAGHEAPTEQAEPVPAQTREAAPVRLRVLGPVLLETPAGPVTTGMRSGSYTILASLAVHPSGRTLDQLAADLHPDTDPGTAGKRIRTDISTTRRVLRAATGNSEAMFVVYDPATGRYRLDAELIGVDLWQMLTAIEVANTADDDTQALTLLREVVELYGGDFADGADQTWITDHATTYRHQILSVYARIAEILEPDHPDQAVAALERALQFDPVNEELYQRVMRIHGRAGRTDQVWRTLRRLEERLADLGDAEPSQATRRVADRQLRPATAASRGPR
ncbi:hypothetical protein Asp14428_32830 [Actinoplanes sp. NBRC 14428]|nr:hypothetical protein Asp14428_32830 [Actinoplanes sp. NBRC 14428]